MQSMIAGRRATLIQAGLAFAVMAGTVVAAGVLNARVVAAIDQSRLLVARANSQADAVRGVVEALKDIQNGDRGFLLTGDERYLRPYDSGMAALRAGLARLDTLSDGAPLLSGDARAFAAAAREMAGGAARLVALVRAGDHDAAMAMMRSGNGRATMDLVAASADQLRQRINDDHEARLGDVRAREAFAARASLATAVLCAALLGFTVLVLLRGRMLHQRAQLALSDLAGRLSGTIAHLRDGIAVFDRRGDLLLWNDQLLALTQLPAGVVRAGLSIDAMVGWAWPGVVLSPPARDVPTAQEFSVGPRTLEVWRGWMPDDGQILMVADTTRRTQAESIARQAQKMEALGQLTGGVAHDFNNLLQVISANLELVGRRVAGQTEVADRLMAAISAIERAGQLTRRLLAFARRQPLTPQPIDTPALLDGLRDMLARTLGGGIDIQARMAADLWPVLADPQQLESALLNLSLNARDAMDGHGRLSIDASNEVVTEADPTLAPDLAIGRYVCIAVGDSGVGMTAEQLARAVEPFYTTKPEGRGTGLGLSMVFGFAKQSQGHLYLASEPGRGTTARLWLPSSPRAPERLPEGQPAPASTDRELVLVVEDDEAVRATATETLRGLGYRTEGADSAAAALRLLADGLRPDLLFTDVVMPGAPDARAMADQARRIIPRLPVVFTSGDADLAIEPAIQGDPVALMLAKPWRAAELAQALRHALEGGHPVPAAPLPPRRLRIVLAEEDDIARMMAADILMDLGHEVIETSAAAAALEAVAAGCDLLITDLALRGMDGRHFAARALALRPDMPVVVASGLEADPSSAHVWLKKPYDAAALRDAVERAAEA